MKKSPAILFRAYLASLFSHTGPLAAFYIVLLVAVGLTQGIGLMLLIPLLRLLGIGGGETDSITAMVQKIFTALGAPLTLPVILIVFVILVSLQALASRYLEVMGSRIVQGFTCFLRESLYRDLAGIKWLLFLRLKSTDITHALTMDVQRIGTATQFLLRLLGTLVLAVVHISVALKISLSMTFLALFCGSLFLLFMRRLDQRAQSLGRKQHRRMQAMFSSAGEHLSGMKVARSYGFENRYVENFIRISRDVSASIIDFSKVNSNARMYFQTGTASALALFIFGTVRLTDLPGPSLLVMVFLFVRLMPMFSQSHQSWQHMLNALPSFEAVSGLQQSFRREREDTPPGDGTPVPLKSALSLQQVSFRYNTDTENQILNNIDLEIPAGGTVALAGPSGSGKTTLADIIIGLIAPEKGRVLIDGEPLEGAVLAGWRGSVGYVPQDSFLFHDTVRANLLWARPEANDAEIMEALDLAAAADFVSRLPNGLDTILGDRGVRLSGGERQRLALARALLRKPSLLLLDEATSNLDVAGEQRIREAIERLHGQMTIIIIAHRLSTIRKADTIMVMEKGKIVEQGSWDELAAREQSRFKDMIRIDRDPSPSGTE